jgi:hypothetical protein
MTRPESGSNPGGAAAGYAGDLSPKEAWDLLAREKGAVLVDCRSQAEWSFVGVPDLGALGKSPVMVEWQSFVPASAETGGKPRMSANKDFVADGQDRNIQGCARRIHLPLRWSVSFGCGRHDGGRLEGLLQPRRRLRG